MNTHQQIDARIKAEAQYFLINKSTTRETGKHFNLCKSTIYDDLTKKLKYIDLGLYKPVMILISLNKSIRNLIGGYETHTKSLL